MHATVIIFSQVHKKVIKDKKREKEIFWKDIVDDSKAIKYYSIIQDL